VLLDMPSRSFKYISERRTFDNYIDTL